MDRAEAIKKLEQMRDEFNEEWVDFSGVNEALDLAIEALQEPTLVRCKDCKHRDLFSCPLIDNDFQKDEDFCSWGEAEKHQLSGETSTNTPTNTSTNEGDAETATATDCISRQQAIKAIEGVDWYHVNSKGELVHGSTSDEESWYKAEDIYKAIESLPPVTPTEQTIKEIMDFIGGMNMTGEISNEAYAKISDFVDDGTPTERTGEWVEVMIRTDSGIGPVKDWWYCSLCNNHVSYKYNYCPNCGAKMEG